MSTIKNIIRKLVIQSQKEHTWNPPISKTYQHISLRSCMFGYLQISNTLRTSNYQNFFFLNHLSIHLSFLSFYISVLSIFLYICPIYLSVYLCCLSYFSFYVFINLSIYNFIYLSIHLYIIHQSLYPSIYVSIYLSVSLSILLSIYTFIYLSIQYEELRRRAEELQRKLL